MSEPVGSTFKEQTTLPFGTSIDSETSGVSGSGSSGTGAPSNQRFTSYDRSEDTGLDYAVNRTYNSGQSRFTTVDPIGMASASRGDPQSLNLFAYTRNNPVDFVDPSGLYKEIEPSPYSDYGRLRFEEDSDEFNECALFGSGCPEEEQDGTEAPPEKQDKKDCDVNYSNNFGFSKKEAKSFGIGLGSIRAAVLTIFGESSPFEGEYGLRESVAIASVIVNRSSDIRNQANNYKQYRAKSADLYDVVSADSGGQFHGFNLGYSNYNKFKSDSKKYEFRMGERNCNRITAAANGLRNALNGIGFKFRFFVAKRQKRFTGGIRPIGKNQYRIGGNDFSEDPISTK